MRIEAGTEQDVDSWMSLVEKVKNAFPGLEQLQYSGWMTMSSLRERISWLLTQNIEENILQKKWCLICLQR